MELFSNLVDTLLATLRDVLPIAVILFGFQVLVLRQPIPHLKRTLTGIFYVIIGLAFFLVGLKEALFPLGELMATQLTDPVFLFGSSTAIPETLNWLDYRWVYAFAAALGFATTIAEPSLIAVAIKAQQVSGGAIHIWGLRIAVAIGVALGLAIGTYRLISGTPLHYFIIGGYIIVIIQTLMAPKMIIPLAYDSGGVSTSTVTVPLVAALGLGLAKTVPDRSPLLDGFGLIAFACLFPIISVMGYAQIVEWRERRAHQHSIKSGDTKP